MIVFGYLLILYLLNIILIDKVNPNEERYWKKIIKDAHDIEKLYCRLEKIDNIVKKVFPFLKRYCWNIAIISYK